MRGGCVPAFLGIFLCAAESRFEPHTVVADTGYDIRGAALHSGELFVWGGAVERISIRSGKRNRVADGDFSEGGCVLDLDRDRKLELALNDLPGSALVWLRPRGVPAMRVDTQVEMHDCHQALLFGRSGILIVQRHLQVRFYERPPARRSPGVRWPYREIYSFYTASLQGGLLLVDIDKDGRTDIVSGNYWIRSPEEYHLPWRLFAINADHATEFAALARIVFVNRPGSPMTLAVAQGEMPDGRLTLYTRPADPTELWPETRVDEGLKLRYPHGLAAGDLDGDGSDEIAVAENAGPGSRLLVLWNRSGGYAAELIAETSGVHTLLSVDCAGDPRPDLLTVSRREVICWENRAGQRVGVPRR